MRIVSVELSKHQTNYQDLQMWEKKDHEKKWEEEKKINKKTYMLMEVEYMTYSWQNINTEKLKITRKEKIKLKLKNQTNWTHTKK